MKANVFVTLKTEVLDPQGEAVRRSLQSLGFDGVEAVRVGKFIEIDLGATSQRDEAKRRVQEMCQKLLANPVIENYRVDLAE